MKNFTDEKTLLREIKNGNGEAFEFLFNSYYPRLRGYAARFVTDEEAVRDIIQESFLRFWEKRDLIHHAIVLPVLNSKSSISCKIKRTSYFGFLKWEGGSSQYAYVKDMPRHSEFSLGDTIVTSGHSAVFPAGIPVGTVDDMEDSHDGLSYLLKVKLFTDFARLNNVRVLGSFNGTEQAQLEDSIHSMQP